MGRSKNRNQRSNYYRYILSKSKFKRESRRSLEKELRDLSSHRDSLDITDEILDKRINDIEKKLEQIYNQKAKEAQIRSREKCVELGEKNNSYVLVLEKVKQSISMVTR